MPDPTTLTTEALQREIAILNRIIDERLKGMDDLMDEKFRGVDKEFALVERQRVEQKKDATVALEAALKSAKDAVAEQTATATKNIDTLGKRFDTAFDAQTKAIDTLSSRVTVIEASKIGGTEATADHAEIEAVKSRLTSIEAAKVGGQEVTTERRLSMGGIYGAIAAAVAVITLAILILGLVLTS